MDSTIEVSIRLFASTGANICKCWMAGNGRAPQCAKAPELLWLRCFRHAILQRSVLPDRQHFQPASNSLGPKKQELVWALLKNGANRPTKLKCNLDDLGCIMMYIYIYIDSLARINWFLRALNWVQITLIRLCTLITCSSGGTQPTTSPSSRRTSRTSACWCKH